MFFLLRGWRTKSLHHKSLFHHFRPFKSFAFEFQVLVKNQTGKKVHRMNVECILPKFPTQKLRKFQPHTAGVKFPWIFQGEKTFPHNAGPKLVSL